MSLFPAYTQNNMESDLVTEQDSDGSPCPTLSLAMETQLLESDSECENVTPAAPVQPPAECDEYYEDNKFDCGNLRVSTLYYPGRPWYDVQSNKILGLEKHSFNGKKKKKRQKRYYESKMEVSPNTEVELAVRTSAYQQMLTETPHDEQLWIQFIDLQEYWSGCGEARAAAEAAAARLPRSPRVRARRHCTMLVALPTEQYLAALRDEIAAERSVLVRTEMWVRLLEALAGAGTLSGPDALAAVASAALADVRHHPRAYPLILYAYGSYLQAAGLWERLVLLLELVAAMSLTPAGFPPPADRERDDRVDHQLQEYEDKMIASGLPLSAVWVRVERARAAAHWRPAAASPADPQRAPLPADVADLLLPLYDPSKTFLLIVQMLRLAKVPLLPGAGYATASVSAGVCGEAARGAEALLPLVHAARRLPPAHPARPSAECGGKLIRMLLDPPHYFTNESGFLSWVNALWDASCSWVCGERRVALLCWRLRWLHSLLLILDIEDESGAREARRIRESARALLKREAGESPLPFAEFARIELCAAGAERAQRAALAALRAALAHDHATPPHHVIYVARVVCEVYGVQSAEARWALACAALGRAPPLHISTPPPADVEHAALQTCEERCDELEHQFEVADVDEESPLDPCCALLPSEAEWACARALLAPPNRRHQLYSRETARVRGRPACNAQEARYREQSAEELAATAGRRAPCYARALAIYYPDNALLALLSSGAPLWAWDAAAPPDVRLATLAARGSGGAAALAYVLPPVLRALNVDTPAEWGVAANALRRAARHGGALLWSARLEAEARAPRPRLKHALYAALDALPHDKWLCVRGAAWCSGEAAALADLLLERQLRLHALRDELAPSPALAGEQPDTSTAPAT